MATIVEALDAAIRHHEARRLNEAEQICRQILAIDPTHVGAWHLLGLVASDRGNAELAIGYYQRALEISPAFPEAHYNLGRVFQQQGKLDEAAASYQSALKFKPDLEAAHNNLGNVLQDLGKPDEAAVCYRRVLAKNPNNANAHNNLGNALSAQGKMDEAVLAYQQAVALRPNFAEAYYNLGNAWQELEKPNEAITCFRRAVTLRPDFAQGFNNLGSVLREQGRRAEALECFQRALTLRPHFAEAHVNQSYLMLLEGDFDRGWREYEWRSKCRDFGLLNLQQQAWDGQALGDKTIFLHAEQGFGDTLQFIRYARLVKERGATVILGCQPALLRLLADFPVDQVIGTDGSLPSFDFQAPLISLPRIFKTSLDTIPQEVPYLFARSDLVATWREKLAPVAGFRIGINWHGRAGHGFFRLRDIPLDCFASLSDVPGVRLISLQKGAGREELAAAGERMPVIDLGDDIDTEHGPFMDTAAIMMNLDLVITSDTAIAHLAGALGVSVWVALPFVPDWRWLLDRRDSPWYPTLRLFRQPRPGDWPAVFAEIGLALKELVNSPRGPEARLIPSS